VVVVDAPNKPPVCGCDVAADPNKFPVCGCNVVAVDPNKPPPAAGFVEVADWPNRLGVGLAGCAAPNSPPAAGVVLLFVPLEKTLTWFSNTFDFFIFGGAGTDKD
jgi:hypothetical protein